MTPKASSRYPYQDGDPPAPFVFLNVTHPTDGDTAGNIPALVDTGADQTVLPANLLERLRVPESGAATVRGYDNKPNVLKLYVVRLQIRDLSVIVVEVIGSDTITHAVVGRDVLNRYDIHLDGPNRVMIIKEPA